MGDGSMPVFMCPKSQGPWSLYSNTTWMSLKAYQIKSQSMTGSKLETYPNSVAEFRFITPDYIETITHSWNPYETIASKINQKMSSIAQELKVVKDVVSSTSTNLETFKADTPLKYEGSERRQWNFELPLVSMGNKEGRNRSIYDVVPIVKALKELSTGYLTGVQTGNVWGDKIAAGAGFGLQKLLPPYVFELRIPYNATSEKDAAVYVTSPDGFVIIDTIQPTFKPPYRDGLPTLCDLTLTLKELAPFYRSNPIPNVVAEGDTVYSGTDNWGSATPTGTGTTTTTTTTLVGGVDVGVPF